MDAQESYVIKEAVDITSIDYEQYGVLYNLSGDGIDTQNTNNSSGDGWTDVDTRIPLLDTLGSLGYTHGSGTPFLAGEMERHLHTQEAQIPLEQAIVFCVAKASQDAPKISDVIPVILRPGFVFVLHRSVWHTSSHGLTGAAHYHWMALAYQNEPTVWEKIIGGPVCVHAPS